MIARSLIGLVFVPIFGFSAACFASPLAWILADAFWCLHSSTACINCRKQNLVKLQVFSKKSLPMMYLIVYLEINLFHNLRKAPANILYIELYEAA